MISRFSKVRTDRERICYYVLSQIIYPELDTPSDEGFECLYDFADDFDEIILRWENGRPVAFYTIKMKGTFFFPFFESVTNSIAMIRSFGSTFLWSKRVFMKCEEILSKSRLIDSIFRGNRDLCNFQKINLQINWSNSSINRKSCRHFFCF